MVNWLAGAEKMYELLKEFVQNQKGKWFAKLSKFFLLILWSTDS